MDTVDKNYLEKKEMYGKIFEREKIDKKGEQKNKVKEINEKNKCYKKININIGNNNKKKDGLLSNKSNAFLQHVKTTNIRE